jgi:hypothetical protein
MRKNRKATPVWALSLPPQSWREVLDSYEVARADALEPVESDEEIDLLGGAQSAATERLLTAPAPDLEALAYKLEVFRREDCFALSLEYREPLFEALIEDLRRLGKE